MKRTVKTVDRQTYIIEEFSSFGELLSTNDSRKPNFGHDGGARDRTDNYFCGGTYNQAVEMLRYGWCDKEKVKKIVDKIQELQNVRDVQKLSFKNDIVGYAPIVPLALRGVPQNMINCTRQSKKVKVINLIVEISASGNVTSEEKLDWGAKMVSKIMNLEKAGYRVRVDLVKAITEDSYRGKVHAMKIMVKSENQPFDIKRMMFPIAHTMMQRRISWDWYERLPEAEEYYGYGTPLKHHSYSHKETVMKNIAGTDNSYVVCCMDDIDQALKGIA